MWLVNMTRWPVWLVFVVAGLSAVGLAFVTVNLFGYAMANLGFIAEFGWLALQLGAAVQLMQLIAWGALALIVFLIFRASEIELLYRYFKWAGQGREMEGDETRRKMRFRRDGN